MQHLHRVEFYSNCIQVMAIQEHPYYGSFGYHVSSFFAPSSRFGTPEELKELIDTAHKNGVAVIMDIVHSHAVKNEVEGLGNLAGDPNQFFYPGDRHEHPAWDSLCFDYGKDEVLHFLLSNCKYWLEEFKFDGFRFDGVTSMLYYSHGLGEAFGGYGDYFNGHEDDNAICYLTLANKLIHEGVEFYSKLDGFDNDWIDAGSRHAAGYANLPSGHYTFRVRITDSTSDEASSDERRISVVVEPAPMLSWWAWLIYLALGALLAWYLYRNAKRVVAARRAARKAEMEKEQELRTNQMNMSFFANIAHEFRTPLTMIAGPVGQLAKSDRVGDEERSLLSIAQRSIQRMFKLVNQLMDFNKLENDTLRLSVEQLDVVELMNNICDTFEFNAKEKGLTLSRFGMEDQLMAWTDGDKLEKIVSNLLSNALKFTPRGGRIDVHLDVVDDQVKVTIADTGKGIPEEHKENIFKRFYQLDNQTKAVVNYGTGIGLYYARRLAELHHGTLTAGNRTDGEGAVFTLVYPMNKEAYTDAERSPLEGDGVADYRIVDSPASVGSHLTPLTSHLSNDDDSRPTILVVDDDTEIINYMRMLFSHDYRLITCLDADTALEEMRAAEPNIVLSDVAMPGKDGYQLCQEIKQDIQLSHIPVILVTAKVTAENQVEGLNVGADAYVTKPFEPAVLSALIQSQLKNRDRVRKLLTNATTTEDESVDNALSEQDKHFMEELYKLMEEELSNSELDVTRITKMLYISRTKLY